MTRGTTETETETHFRTSLRLKLDPWPTPVVFLRGTNDTGPRMAIVVLSALPAIPYRSEEQPASETGIGIGTETRIEDPDLATVVDIHDELQLFLVHILVQSLQH